MTPDSWLLRCFDQEARNGGNWADRGWGRALFEILDDHPGPACAPFEDGTGCVHFDACSWPEPALGHDVSFGAWVGEAIAS